jgi:hypothetical protein
VDRQGWTLETIHFAANPAPSMAFVLFTREDAGSD